ncbi:MAG: YsnF/AvaK domain-containing protein [Anaerolineae bacterium]
MERLDTAVVRGKDGLHGVIESTLAPSSTSGEEQILIRLDNGRQLVTLAKTLVRQADGSYYLPLSLAELEPQGDSNQTREEAVVVPVMVEELEVQKRPVEKGGVRIIKRVHAQEEMVDEPLLQEELDIKRVPINRPVDGSLPIRYQGNTMIVSLLEEILVVERRLVLKEELHITKRQSEIRKPQTVTLRSEEAIIEPLGTQNP